MNTQTLLSIVADQREELLANDYSELCPRPEESQLDLKSNRAQVVIGVRRCGKSTLCEMFLKQKGIDFAYVNFDDDRMEDMKASDLDHLLEALYMTYGEFKYLFLDEIQNIEGWPLFVNRLLRQKMHLFITGSNSKLLSKELSTHLTGRNNKVELYPFSYSEYCAMKNIDTTSLSTKAKGIRKSTLHEYLLQGGFPELFNESNRRGYGALNGEAKWEDKVMELMDAVDTWIPLPPRDVDKPFLMPVEDVFSITGRGTVATGRIEAGRVKVGDEVQILGLGADKKSVVTGVEMFRKILDEGEAGDNVGLLLRGIDKNEIKRGMVICHPGQVKPHDEFKAQVYILKKEEGGRHTPFHNHYRPQFYIRTLDVTGEITLPEGVEMVMPGDHVTIQVKLITPVACDKGLRFAIREGGRTVGSGQITEILE